MRTLVLSIVVVGCSSASVKVLPTSSTSPTPPPTLDAGSSDVAAESNHVGVLDSGSGGHSGSRADTESKPSFDSRDNALAAEKAGTGETIDSKPTSDGWADVRSADTESTYDSSDVLKLNVDVLVDGLVTPTETGPFTSDT